ncbi:ribosome maturation factor RimP [Pararhodonellum marinum]|uniref:ribosome maturation factor RimP n=1 Tax=Pararhodonellum marinum TaxID=2755358 RepID=UPI00188E6A6B|nr:ribosome maturation factor RimP [Pararhodonellum marinum]
MSLKETITQLVEKHLPDESHFVVEVSIVTSGAKKHIKVLIDGDQGVSISTCALVSRALGNQLEEGSFIEEAYVLEVSSPGLDFPLSNLRQYKKNIGRNLKVLLKDGQEVEGKLLSVSEESILLLTKKKEKGKKAVEVETSIVFDQINKTIVLVSFK